jgi:hypothetical protein
MAIIELKKPSQYRLNPLPDAVDDKSTGYNLTLSR